MPDIPPAQETTLRDMNRMARLPKTGDGDVTAASLFALWILIPMALGATAFVLIGVWHLMSEYAFDPPSMDLRIWLALTLVLQAGYWVVLARIGGRSPARGLWALVPGVALIPTFGIARNALVKARN